MSVPRNGPHLRSLFIELKLVENRISTAAAEP